MAHAWALIEFTDANGKHEPNEPLDLPRETDADKAEFDRLQEYGVITTTEPKATGPSGDEPAEPATSRRRRSGSN